MVTDPLALALAPSWMLLLVEAATTEELVWADLLPLISV
jgi:hypothetical protein